MLSLVLHYDAGDLEIEVEWMDRDGSGGDERRTFCVWERRVTPDGEVVDPGPEQGKTYTFNSTELRAVDLTLTPVPPVGGAPLGVVGRVRRGAAMACDAARRARLHGVVQAVHEVVAPAPRSLWTLSSADENVILYNCW